MAHDPYAVLGLGRSATPEEVQAAYRARSMLLHPDLHQGRSERVRREATRAMAQLTAAYEALAAPGAGSSRGGSSGDAAAPVPVAFRLGRLVGRAAPPVKQDGRPATAAYRLGSLIARRRPR